MTDTATPRRTAVVRVDATKEGRGVSAAQDTVTISVPQAGG
ncbi:MAG TPA: hypothetical protein VFP54_12780 [Acidimicrobiales bacterium]|nr:hypothetical protein [Acidimicrobiales bacterium]